MFDQISIQCPRCNEDTDNPIMKGTYHVCGNCNAILIPLFESNNIVTDVIDSTDTFVSPTISEQKINWNKVPLEFLMDKGWSNPTIMIEKLRKGDYVKKSQTKSQGIGGWLALFAIGLFASLLICLLNAYLSNDLIDTYKLNQLHNHDLYSLLDFKLTGNLMFAVYLILLIFLMYSKNKAFRGLAIVFLVSNLLFSLVEMGMLSDISNQNEKIASDMSDIIRGLIGAAIWIPYFVYSTRVKNTFVKSFFKKRKLATA